MRWEGREHVTVAERDRGGVKGQERGGGGHLDALVGVDRPVVVLNAEADQRRQGVRDNPAEQHQVRGIHGRAERLEGDHEEQAEEERMHERLEHALDDWDVQEAYITPCARDRHLHLALNVAPLSAGIVHGGSPREEVVFSRVEYV